MDSSPPQQSQTLPQRARIQSVDALRGLIMIIMVLDHARAFIHSGAQGFNPEDLTKTFPFLFFTRWITHFCAPVFMFTAGIGANQYLSRGHTKRDLVHFLLSRGVWLVFLELTVIRFAMLFNLNYGMTILGVIWALGWCMIFLAGLIYLPLRILTVGSFAMIALHNLADGINAAQFGGLSWLWLFLHQRESFFIGDHKILCLYPVIPWVAVMALGFCFGELLTLASNLRQKWMYRSGLTLTIAFVVIRAINLYGDPIPWTHEPTSIFTFLSFLKTSKYPPSLEFLLMTLGPALIMLALLERKIFARTNPLLIFGKVPLFFYIAHLFVLHGTALVMAMPYLGKGAFFIDPLKPETHPPGFSLMVVYLVWLAVLFALYPVCLWFSRVKEARTDLWWLKYL